MEFDHAATCIFLCLYLLFAERRKPTRIFGQIVLGPNAGTNKDLFLAKSTVHPLTVHSFDKQPGSVSSWWTTQWDNGSVTPSVVTPGNLFL